MSKQEPIICPSCGANLSAGPHSSSCPVLQNVADHMNKLSGPGKGNEKPPPHNPFMDY